MKMKKIITFMIVSLAGAWLVPSLSAQNIPEGYEEVDAEIRKEQNPGDVYPNSFFFDCFPGIEFKPIDLHP